MAASGWVKVAIGIFFTFCTSMIVVGFQGILPTFDDCSVWNASRGEHGRAASNSALDNMYTAATSAINISALFVGFYIRRVGPRVACATGGLIVALGALLFAFASKLDVPQLWTIGYIVMASGGPFVCFSMFTLPSLVDARHQALVVSMVIGSLDASALVMYLLNVVHKNTGACEKDLFLGFAALPLLLVFASLWLFQRPASSASPNGKEEEESDLEKPLTENASGDVSPKAAIAVEGPWVAGEDEKTLTILRSPEFMLAILWAGMFLTSKYFYIENVEAQLSWISGGDAHRVNTGVSVFSVMLPAAGLFTPITAALFDKGGIVFSLTLMGFLQLLVGVCSVIPVYPLQFVTMAALVFNRFFFFAAAPIVLTKLWGSRGINELYGIQLFLGAIMNLSNFFWTYVSESVTHGNFCALNLSLNGATFAVAMWFAYSVRKWRDRSVSRLA